MARKTKREKQLAKIEKSLAHPIRTRIVAWLRHRKPSTQREIGRALSMTTAKVHYHLGLLADLKLIKPAGTRPGPKGITEKLFKVDLTYWQSLSDTPGRDSMDLMLRFTVDLMREHNRQGVSILEGCWDRPFIAGNYPVHCSKATFIRFKRKIDKLFEEFAAKNGKKEKVQPVWSLTFAAMPSSRDAPASKAIFEYEPPKP